MSFIGIFTNSKDLNLIRAKVLEHINSNTVNIIKINKKNIENIKNIKFETIIICNTLEQMEEMKVYLEKIIKNAKYLILNSDINLKLNIDNKEKLNIITYGLNQKATMTVSSINEENILISLQREVKNIYNNTLGLTEINVDLKEYKNIKIDNILIIYIIFIIYQKK